MPRSVRFYWRDVRGRATINVNWPAINADSTVKVMASEWAANPAGMTASPRFVGDATITVRNVAPHGPPADPNNGVTFIVDVDWPDPLNVVTDIVLLEDSVPLVQHPALDWHRLAFAVQRQQQTNWCWCAVTVSISNSYGDNLNQCGFANTELGRNDCCGTGGPDTGKCNVTHYTKSALMTAGHFASAHGGGPSVDEARSEVDNGRPIALRIEWSGGGRHAIALYGYLAKTDYVAVDDPANGPTDVLIGTLNASYLGSGSVIETLFTAP